MIKAYTETSFQEEEDSQTTTRKKRKKTDKDKLFLEYGIAIENFFNLQKSMIKIYFILTLLAIPQMAVFASYNANASFQFSSVFDMFSFGSLGQADAVCSKAPNLPYASNFTFQFSCSKNYEVSTIFSTGLLGRASDNNKTDYSETDLSYDYSMDMDDGFMDL